MMDENHGYDVKILDVSDFNNITVMSTFNTGTDPPMYGLNSIIKRFIIYILLS